MPDSTEQEQPVAGQNSDQEQQQQQDPIIKDPAAVLRTIETLRAEVKTLRASKSEPTTPTVIPPEITAELDKLRKFQEEVTEREKEQQRKDLEARGQYEALLQNARADADRQLNASKEREKHLQTELGKLTTTVQEREAILKEYRLRTAARDAFFAQGGKRGDESQGGDFFFDLVWKSAIAQNLNEGDNGVEVVDGGNLLLDEETKQPLDLSGLIKLRKSAYGFAFEGDPTSSGSGRPPVNGGRPQQPKGKLVMPRTALSNRTQQIEWARQNGITDISKISAGIQNGEITIE